MNGHKEILPKGMFRRHSLDVTDILHPDGKNLLAVLIYPPDHPGKIPPGGGQGGDHEVCAIFILTANIYSSSNFDEGCCNKIYGIGIGLLKVVSSALVISSSALVIS